MHNEIIEERRNFLILTFLKAKFTVVYSINRQPLSKVQSALEPICAQYNAIYKDDMGDISN